MSWSILPWVYPVWDSLGFLDLGDYFFPHFREVFNYYLSSIFSWPFFFSSSAMIQMLWHLTLSHFPGLSCSGSSSQVLHKGTDLVGPAFCALPRSKQLRHQVLGKCAVPGVWCVLSPPRSQLLGFLGVQ